MKTVLLLSITVSLLVLWALGCGGGGGYGGTSANPTTPTGTPSGNIGTTVTLTPNGVSAAHRGSQSANAFGS